MGIGQSNKIHKDLKIVRSWGKLGQSGRPTRGTGDSINVGEIAQKW